MKNGMLVTIKTEKGWGNMFDYDSELLITWATTGDQNVLSHSFGFVGNAVICDSKFCIKTVIIEGQDASVNSKDIIVFFPSHFHSYAMEDAIKYITCFAYVGIVGNGIINIQLSELIACKASIIKWGCFYIMNLDNVSCEFAAVIKQAMVLTKVLHKH